MTPTLVRKAHTGESGNPGQFGTHGRQGAGIDLGAETTDVAQRRADAAQWALNEYGEIPIVDHSIGRQGIVQLSQMGDPDIARGNCWSVTNEIIEEAGAGELEASWVDEISMTNRRVGGQHVAVLAGDQDGLYIIDYTIRQFGAGLPFPYTGTVDEWKATVERCSGAVWDINEHENEEQ